MARFVDRKVAENYVFMTLLQVLNACFYLLLYPFLIRVLSPEGYGLYTFSTAIIWLIITFINFGFDLPGAKFIAQHTANKSELEQRLSDVLTSKLWLELIAAVFYILLLCLIPSMHRHWTLYAIGFFQTISFVLFPQWYYQGVQRMRLVTYIQLFCKVLTIPFVFALLHSPDDVWLLMLFNTLSSVLGGCIAFLLIRFQDGLHIRLVSFDRVITTIREATPFFLSNVAGVVKEQGIVLITGSFLGLADVAIYDLANKIIIIPRTIFAKANDAIYPKMMAQGQACDIKRILHVETILGLVTILAIVLAGPIAVRILGGEQMFNSYYVSIILSITVLSWLVVGALLQFCVIPSGETYWVTINQIQATVLCLGIAAAGVALFHNVFAVSAGIAVSALAEIIFCAVLVKRRRLL